jgi:hypothetical protein
MKFSNYENQKVCLDKPARRPYNKPTLNVSAYASPYLSLRTLPYHLSPTLLVKFFTSDFSLTLYYLINGAHCQGKRKLILVLTLGRFYGIIEVERKNL